jgi:hypothetical protein
MLALRVGDTARGPRCFAEASPISPSAGLNLSLGEAAADGPALRPKRSYRSDPDRR